MTVASCFGAAIATAQPADSLAGIWIGRVDLDSHPASLQVTVRATTGQPWTADVVLQPIEAISANTVEARRIADSWRNASVVSDGTAWSVTAGIGSNAIQIVAGNREVANTAAVTFKDRRAQSRSDARMAERARFDAELRPDVSERRTRLECANDVDYSNDNLTLIDNRKKKAPERQGALSAVDVVS